ncbi:MAG: alpha/beta fold hydrolase [Gammaproteobacteria bacterium]|nr:alpha/beta fold hydrolase [Gammaproteobacteria bacterium]
MPSIKASFTGGSGHKLDARLEIPNESPKAYAICCHCFTCSKDTLTSYRISKEMAKKGYATLRFDFTGLGGSEGVFSKTGFSSNVSDVLAAIEYLRTFHQAPALLIGHSLGGTAVLEAAIQTDEAGVNNIRAVATIASPSQPDHVLHHFGYALTLLEQGIASSIEVAGEYYDIEPEFVEDLRSYNMQQRLQDLNKPVLIFNVINDALVSENNATELNKWINGDSKIITLENSDHLLSNKPDTVLVTKNIKDWFENI